MSRHTVRELHVMLPQCRLCGESLRRLNTGDIIDRPAGEKSVPVLEDGSYYICERCEQAYYVKGEECGKRGEE